MYINFDNLKMVSQNEMLKDLPSIIHLNQLCEECLVGKQFCKSFSKESTPRASQLYKKYMSMFVVLSNHVCLVKIYIFYFLLMLIVEKLRYTS